jgi:DNA replication protein DnaC
MVIMNVEFNQIIQRFEKGEKLFLADKVRIRIPNAEQRLRGGLDYFVNKYTFGEVPHAKWLEKNYRPIVDWMSDNEGRGLLITGGCGLGKTLIAKHILPLLLQDSCKKIVSIFSAQELNTKIDEILKLHIICIDDIGTEELAKIFGNVRCAFSELCDAAEQKGKLLIITTNLTATELEVKYGERTIDRLKAITKFVPFTGKSLRK